MFRALFFIAPEKNGNMVKNSAVLMMFIIDSVVAFCHDFAEAVHLWMEKNIGDATF